MNNKLLKITSLTVLMLGSALHAMDVPRNNKLNREFLEAARKGKRNKVRKLINEGANVNAQSDKMGYEGASALMLATNSPEISKLLIEKGADVNMPNPNSNETALFYAARAGNKKVCELLIARKAQVNARNNLGATPLMAAAHYGHIEICDLLIKNNADVDSQNEEGMTALMNAVRDGYSNVCELLIKANANVNAQDENGGTALMWATSQGHLELCKLLIAAGANVTATNQYGTTALMVAAQNSHEDVCKLLINAMVKPTKKDLAPLITTVGIQKQAPNLKLISKDVVRLIGKDAYNQIVQRNKSNAKEEIEKITDEKMKQDLLDYLNSI